MKEFLLAGIILAFVSTAVNAEILYVVDIAEITLRTGPGIDHRVIAMVKSGQEMEILESGPEWTKVRTPSEKEGYVLSRFLTGGKPSKLLLSELQKQYESLEKTTESLRTDLKQQKAENKRLVTERSDNEERLATVTKSYESLRKDSTEFLRLKENFRKANTQLGEITEKAQEYETALINAQKWHIFRWILTGAGILLAGFLIGLTSRRQKRRSSLL